MVGCNGNIPKRKPKTISTNVKDWERFQWISLIIATRVTRIEIFLLISQDFYLYIHTPTLPKGWAEYSRTPEQEYIIPRVERQDARSGGGGGCSFFSTVLQREVISFNSSYQFAFRVYGTIKWKAPFSMT